jgi:large subunit ribosomal protein L7/L12
MKVGEIGFVIRKSDGTYVGRKSRSHPERPFRAWEDANRVRHITPYSVIVPVQLVPAIVMPDIIRHAVATSNVTNVTNVVAVAPAAPAPADEFTVVLKSAGANKINVIKAVREVTVLGLREAKDLVDGTSWGPRYVKVGLPKTEADAIVKKLRDAGAEAEVE